MAIEDVNVSASTGFWWIGFLFTTAFLEIDGWGVVWALFSWPYQLGKYFAGLV